MQVVIEEILNLKGGQYIFVTISEGDRDFIIKPGARLGSIELEHYLDMPRVLDSNGEQRTDLFILKPKIPIADDAFQKGTIMNLIIPD